MAEESTDRFCFSVPSLAEGFYCIGKCDDAIVNSWQFEEYFRKKGRRIIGASKALALELAKRKITVNCIAPGLIETDMISELPLDEVIKQIPSRRVGTTKEVAGLVSYLMSDIAGYVTRQVISINGGMV